MDDKDNLEKYRKLVDRQTEILEGIRGQVDTELNRVLKIYAIAGSFLTLIFLGGVGVAYFLFGDSISGLKDDIRAQTDIVRQQVDARIIEEFQDENLKKYIREAAKTRVDEEVGALIQAKVREQLDPEVERITNEFLDLKNTMTASNADVAKNLRQAEGLINELKERNKSIDDAMEFIMAVLKAQNDSWPAFLKLETWAHDTEHALHNPALMAHTKVRISYTNLLTPPGFPDVLWKPGCSDETASLALINKALAENNPLQDSALVNIINNRKDEFTRKERMEFLIRVLQESESIQAHYFAGMYFFQEANDVNLDWQPFRVKNVLDWWAIHEKDIE